MGLMQPCAVLIFLSCMKLRVICEIIITYMKKFLHFDWLRAVQFLRNTVPKKKFSAKKGNSVQISLDFKFLNFLTTHLYL